MSINKEALPANYSQTGLTINWGSILAGLVFILALGWLLFTLSSAIGLSIMEVPSFHGNDMSTETTALGIAATIWILGSVITAYFLGGFLSGTVSGRTDKSTGMLHGIVLWSCTIIIGIVFSVFGVSGIMNAASGAAKSVTSTGGSAISLIAGQNDVTTSQVPSYLQPLMGSLKQGINKALEKEQQTVNKDSSQYQSSLKSTSGDQKNETQNVAPQKDNGIRAGATENKSPNEANLGNQQSVSVTPQNDDSSHATDTGNVVNDEVEQGVTDRTNGHDESEETSRSDDSSNNSDQENSDNENTAEKVAAENQSKDKTNGQDNQQSLPAAKNDDSTSVAGTANSENEADERQSERTESANGSRFDEFRNHTDQENSDNENTAEKLAAENQSKDKTNGQDNQQSLPAAKNDDSTSVAGTANSENEADERQSERTESANGSRFDESRNYADNHNKSEDRKQESYSKNQKLVPQDVKRNIEKIDPQVLSSIAIALIQDDEKHAKEIITSNFDINNAEVDTLIRTFKQKADQVTKKLEVKINEAKDYAAGLLWVIFLSYLIGLAACIGGAQLAMRFPNIIKGEVIQRPQ